MSDPIHVISLGAGLQSSTMALMASCGKIVPTPAFAVFADTGDESDDTYEWLNKLESLVSFPIHRCSRSILSEHIYEWGHHSQIPAYTEHGIGKRQCTKHWKIVPIHRAIRSITGTERKRLDPGSIVMWQGISTDEASRCKDSWVKWIRNRWPLIELRMSRQDCKSWLSKNGFQIPPKSACVYCPFRSSGQWRKSKLIGGKEWAKIVSVSNLLREHGEFLTDDCLPIDEIDFSSETDNGQLDMFQNECEGHCGL